jgi:amino acid adenylation domain-containing protein
MKLTKNQQEYAASIAVIGKSGKFPGAGDVKQFWRNLCAGIESIAFFSDEELLSEGIAPELLRQPNYVKALGYLENADLFDAQFFGFTPQEARLLDPQHRVFLECAWEALEDAGYASDDPGMVGVYASSSMSRYMRNLWFNPEILKSSDSLQLLTGNDKDHVAMRVSYKLNLQGPSICIQSACSSSLVAVHLACRSLLTYECDMALAGGVSIGVPFKNGYLYQEGGIASSDGHCRAFDAKANGTILGHGAGVVVLKRLFEAMEDGDNIQAIIRGSAVNNDGSNKVGYTAPSVDSQASVIRSALAVARVPSDTITYVEAHGTGTVLGDPIELTALSKAFRSATGKKRDCAIGALKTNIGHLDAAAGVAGLIKTVLALENKQLPPSLNFETPNPKASFETSPFYVNTALSEWNSNGSPRRAGVSSLGMGGTNVHMVLEEAPELDQVKCGRTHHLLVVSAKTRAALDSSALRIADHLQANSAVRLADVARTLQTGRKAFPHRRAVVCESIAEAVHRLRHPDEEGVVSGHAAMRTPPIVFMFPGQGSQYPGMGAGLYRTEPVFREHADQCLELLKKRAGMDLKPILYPNRPFTESDALQLAQTQITQPALFITEYALAKLWMHWGIIPEAMIGHSIGEYVAACLSEVISLEDALTIVAKRGLLMQQTQPGTMLAVSCSAKHVETFVNGTISVAAINTPTSCVVAGNAVNIADLEAVLVKENISCQQLATSHAFHSGMMNPILGHFQREMAKINLGSPKIPYISNLTGGWITDEIATDPANWAQHVRSTVRFADGLATLNNSRERIYLEVGPGRSLSSFVKLSCQEKPPTLVVPSITRHKSWEHESRMLLEALSMLWTAGVQVDWRVQYGAAEAHRTSLPTYPFERRRYFVESRQFAEAQPGLFSSKSGIAEVPSSAPVAPNCDRPELNSRFVAPQNETEKRILEVWRSVLGIEGVGIHDDFWELGGHSLLATQIVSRLKEKFQTALPLRILFEFPTIEKLAEEVSRLQTETADTSLPRGPIRHVERGRKLELSYGQERLWFVHQLEPENVAFNIPGAVRVKGAVDVELLGRTLQEIVRRQESLRTRFVSVQGEPQQVIDAEPAVRLPVVDLSGLGEAEREAEARRLAQEEAQQGFDLALGPLFRAKLLRLGGQEHVLVFNMHHIVSDAWSVGVLVREVSAIYRSFSAGQPSPLPELEIQYADFSAWQRELLNGPVLEEQLGYWKRKLAGVEALELPTDRGRRAQPGNEGATLRFVLSRELAEELRRMARKEGATLYMILLAGFQLLLGRYSGQQDIAVGSPIAGRSRKETEELIGFFINMLVLRTELSGRLNAHELLERVKQTTLEAYANQDVPFEKLVDVLLPQRDLSRTPLFQVMLVLQNVPWTRLELGTAEMLPFEVETGAAQFEISLFLTESSAGIEGSVEYSRNLFDEGSIQRMMEHYRMLLSGMAAHPEKPVAVLPLLSAGERARIIEEWNWTRQEVVETTLVELFERQVERSPEAVALIYGREELSYRELNRRANRVGHYLRGQGVGPDTVVGLCVERSLEMVIGIMGIMKAGGAYVPLDPGYPRERLEYMITDSRPALVLTHSRVEGRLEGIGMQKVRLDADTELLSGRWEENPGREEQGLSADHLAYVIYTSGSTGRPKGVMGVQGGMVNRCEWMWKRYPFQSSDVCCHKTSLSFVDSVAELFVPLLRGVPVVVVPDEAVRDVHELVQVLEEKGISRIVVVPSLLDAMLRTEEKLGERLRKLKLWVSSGEKLPQELLEAFRKEMGRATLLNVYGSSEVSADATWMETGEETGGGSVRIGRPIANTRVYVLDREWQPVPVGVMGELCVGGEGVARGYWQQPGLTAERFVPDPYAGEKGKRMYRTGDLGRFHADGTIEYLGRRDHQVKVHGNRIEIGEIETVLGECAGVGKCAVVAREEQDGEKQLVAYVEGKGEAELSGELLQSFLQSRLPGYMMPGAYVVLERMPLTPNGKLDRQSLPAPSGTGVGEKQEYVGPRTAVEERLCGIWQQVLGAERVGIHENFFRIGGHSLRAAQVVSRMRESFHVELPLRRMFEAPTIAQLADLIQQALQTPVNEVQRPVLPAIKRVERKAAVLP